MMAYFETFFPESVAHCDSGAAAAGGNATSETGSATPNSDPATPVSSLPIAAKPALKLKKAEKYKPLPFPGPVAACAGASQQLLGVLNQQDEGCQVVVSKQITPFLAVMHDFNVGIEQYIPKQMGASIYSFRAVYADIGKVNSVNAQLDWFGRLNGSYTHKWSSRFNSTLGLHIANGGQGDTTSVTFQSGYAGKDYHVSGTAEGVVAGQNKDASLKVGYMQSITQNLAAGVSCKLGIAGSAEAKVVSRLSKGQSIFTGAIGATVPAPGAPLQLGAISATVTRQVTKALAMSTKASYGPSPQTGQAEASGATGWTYGFRDRMISGAVTTNGKISTQFVQMMGSMRWSINASVNHAKSGNNVEFGCSFEVMS